jgi:methylenetetrahydrofolate dehydrogenase (NADP+)/methenyltetrahydrofolate cyclohydrolase
VRKPVETQLLRGKAPSRQLHAEIALSRGKLASAGGRSPLLATLLVGNNAAAEAYRSSIVRTFARIELPHRAVELPATTSAPELVETLECLNHDPAVTGILVLMPLPAHLDPHVVLEHLSPLKDVDGITPTNAGRLHLGLPSLRPSTPQGGIELLDHYQIELEGSRVTVVGRSNVVGRPLATLLSQRHATVTLCHRRTRDLAAAVRGAEIVCVAAGHPGLITGDMLTLGATVIDFGVNVVQDKIVGDADVESVDGVAGALTPVPGGTGPVTTLVLARNTIAAGFAALGGNLDHVEYVVPDAAVSSMSNDSSALRF